MQRLTVVALILLLSHMPVAFAADSLRESAMRAARQLGRAQGQPQRQVELLGVGAAVTVRLANGQRLDGSITSIDAGSFDLAVRRGEVRRITYGEVAELRFVSATYKASGPPNVTGGQTCRRGPRCGQACGCEGDIGPDVPRPHSGRARGAPGAASRPSDDSYRHRLRRGASARAEPEHRREKRDLDRRGGDSADRNSCCGDLRPR